MLPIHDIRQQLLELLAKGNRLVLSAPTGSGKTTQIPQFLYHAAAASQPQTKPNQILVLQPRRMAARLVARRVASEMGGEIGQLVGYQTRHESRVGPGTVIRFMTEGLFLRLLQSDRQLSEVEAVILDEFHERNLATDSALALTKMLQEKSRNDLRLIVMSATLDTELVSGYLGCPVLQASGRAFPVDISYYSRRPTQRVGTMAHLPGRTQVPAWELAGEALADLLEHNDHGDVLIFMPGGYEIRRTIEVCQRLDGNQDLAIFPLYSELPPAQQDEALSPCAKRKVIVSTNVAETSITIEGICHVIDSGMARINRFDPRRGINALMIEPISQASAGQRAGRAGRTAPGTCTRLWPAAEDRHRPAHTTPEVQRLDLAEVVLQLCSLGVDNPADFPWLQPPIEASLQQAITTLRLLGALDEPPNRAVLTPLGKVMAQLPMHPRLSRFIVEASQRRCLDRAALWAALINEPDILLPGAANKLAQQVSDEFPHSDFLVLESAMRQAVAAGFDPGRCNGLGINANAARRVEQTRRLYLDIARSAIDRSQHGSARPTHSPVIELAHCLLLAFPDHLAIRRSEGNLACALTGGRRGELAGDSVAGHIGLILPIEICEIGATAGGQSVRTALDLATEIDVQWLIQTHPSRVTTTRATEFNTQLQAVETYQQQVFDGLVIDRSLCPQTDGTAAAEILADEVLSGRLKLENWDESVEQWIARTRCVAQWFPERRLIRYDPDDIRLITQEMCAGATRCKEIKGRPCLAFVKDVLSWEDQRFIEQMAPERYQLPRGWKMKIDYTVASIPRARAKIQDLYGLNEAPTIAGGRVKLLMEILAPSMRPVQTTDDLGNFWRTLYPTLKKELSRRYPRHEWR